MTELVDTDHEHAATRGEFECPKCIEHIERAEAILSDLHQAERELRTLRRRVNELEKVKAPVRRRTKELEDARLREHVKYEEAVEVFQFWKAHIAPRAVELGGKRLREVLNRLEAGYTAKQLKLAVYGAARHPLVFYGKKRDDLEYICREAHRVDDYMKDGLQALGEDKELGLPAADSKAEHERRAALVKERRSDVGGRG